MNCDGCGRGIVGTIPTVRWLSVASTAGAEPRERVFDTFDCYQNVRDALNVGKEAA